MKGVVVFDTVHGSTKQAAEIIAEEIRSGGHEAEVFSVKEVPPGFRGDFMFIGSPTRNGRMTKPTKEFIESLEVRSWQGRPIVAFDTVGPMSRDQEKRDKRLLMAYKGDRNAASGIAEECLARGLSVSGKMHFAVTGMWGPLAPDALAHAKELTRKILESMK